MGMFVGAGKGGRDEGESWVSGGVGWKAGVEGSGGKAAGGKTGYRVNNTSYLNVGEIKIFGDFTQLVPEVVEVVGVCESGGERQGSREEGAAVVGGKKGKVISYHTRVLSRKALNFHTLFTPLGNRVDVVIPVESIRAISERFANTAYGFVLGKQDMSSYDIALIKIQADVELKHNIVVAMLKLIEEGFYTCNVRVEDAIFDKNRFSSVPKPSQRSLVNKTEDSGSSMVHENVTNKKEAINDEMDSIMGNNTWVLTNLPPSCKPLGYKWIFKRKLKVDGIVEKFKARLVIQVQDHDNYLDSVDEYQEVHEMHNDVQQNYIVDSDTEYTSDSNIILYDQYVENNADQVVQCNVSSMPNDVLMMIINDMYDQAVQCVSANEQNKVVNESLTAKLYALYTGHEIVMTNHAPAVTHDSEDTLEIAEM
nr:zinc finger, CCHC-type [Tanacetum cinerariifolium]